MPRGAAHAVKPASGLLHCASPYVSVDVVEVSEEAGIVDVDASTAAGEAVLEAVLLTVSTVPNVGAVDVELTNSRVCRWPDSADLGIAASRRLSGGTAVVMQT